ncbi:MAG: protein kinase [Kofleriaceae bacterium]|nr:protein kinase [Kofleriaceae bacterium]
MSYHSATPNEETAAPVRLGRYELLGQLAMGGMAEIHLARLAGEAGFEKIVVVKRLLPELVASKAFVAMFLDEGKLVARLDHPNVCEVHELGREGAEYFLVMPYLDGVPVSDFIARPRETDATSRIAQLRVAAGIVVQACAGLHHAHELRGTDGAPLGLVHRDVSPSNLFVTTAGVVKVLDFGVAKVRGAAETEAGTIKGKTQYMAPEQLLGEPLDRRCDVFALGIVLFELATHTRLFKRSSDYLSARAILEEPIPRADAVDPAVPPQLADVIGKALARPPDDRYADARELARALETALAPHGGVASAGQIADALADWHGAELSALRTRQRKVLDDARTSLATGSTVGGRPSNVATQPIAKPRQRPRWIPAALFVVATGAFAGIQQLLNEPADRPSKQVAGSNAATLSDEAAAATIPRIDEPDAKMRATGEPDVKTPAVDEPDTTSPASGGSAGANGRPAAGVASDTRETRTKPSTRVAQVSGTGLVSIDSTPFAMIFIDGSYFGTTPLVKKKLGAGKHKLVARLKDGRKREMRVDIAAGKLAAPIVLTW